VYILLRSKQRRGRDRRPPRIRAPVGDELAPSTREFRFWSLTYLPNENESTSCLTTMIAHDRLTAHVAHWSTMHTCVPAIAQEIMQSLLILHRLYPPTSWTSEGLFSRRPMVYAQQAGHVGDCCSTTAPLRRYNMKLWYTCNETCSRLHCWLQDFTYCVVNSRI
jgi:hypothetical protein